jgi:drug/metabolite transporter (DMT)-like permease
MTPAQRDDTAPTLSRRPWLPYLALLSGILALSLSSLFVRWANDAPGPVTAFYRMAVATAAFAPLFIREVRRHRLGATRRWLFLPLLGGCFTALDHTTWSIALHETRIATATLMNNLAPLWVGLFAALIWRESLRGRFWLGLALTLSGATLVLGSDFIYRPQLNRGNFLALGSSLFYAAYFLTTQRGRERFPALVYIFLVTATASLVLLGINLAGAQPLSGFAPSTYLAFLGAGLISQVIGYFSVAYALGHLPASVVAPTMVAQPVLTALMAIPLAGEPLNLTQILGGMVVLSGIYLVNLSTPQAQHQPTAAEPQPEIPIPQSNPERQP